MTRLVLLIAPEDRIMLEAAAEYSRLPISLWARQTLIEKSRSIQHRKICAPKSDIASDNKIYQWAGKPCTKEEQEAGEKREAKMLAAYEKRKNESAI